MNIYVIEIEYHEKIIENGNSFHILPRRISYSSLKWKLFGNVSYKNTEVLSQWGPKNIVYTNSFVMLRYHTSFTQCVINRRIRNSLCSESEIWPKAREGTQEQEKKHVIRWAILSRFKTIQTICHLKNLYCHQFNILCWNIICLDLRTLSIEVQNRKVLEDKHITSTFNKMAKLYKVLLVVFVVQTSIQDSISMYDIYRGENDEYSTKIVENVPNRCKDLEYCVCRESKSFISTGIGKCERNDGFRKQSGK
jgi:hypothetical protein